MLNAVTSCKGCRRAGLWLCFCLLASCGKLEISDAEKAMQAGNYAEAYCIWHQLAERGHPIAMYNIGWMYHNGFGLVIDDTKAAEWWGNAAESGLDEAEQALGMLYYYGGKGVERDLVRAAGYLMPGAARGDDESALLLDSFIGQLDPALHEEFQHLVQKQQQARVRQLEGEPLVVSASRANLRSEPNAGSSMIGTLTEGTVVAELNRAGDWVKIEYEPGEDAAWIHADLVKPLELD